MDHYYYVTPDAWRVFIDNLEFWKSEWTRFKIAAAPDKKEKSKAKDKQTTQKRVAIEKKNIIRQKDIHSGDYGCVYVQNGVKIKIKQTKIKKVEECFDKNHIITPSFNNYQM